MKVFFFGFNESKNRKFKNLFFFHILVKKNSFFSYQKNLTNTNTNDYQKIESNLIVKICDKFSKNLISKLPFTLYKKFFFVCIIYVQLAKNVLRYNIHNLSYVNDRTQPL